MSVKTTVSSSLASFTSAEVESDGKPSNYVLITPDILHCSTPTTKTFGCNEATTVAPLPVNVGSAKTSPRDFIEDLRLLAKQGKANQADVENVYKSIRKCINGHENELRQIFNKEDLIYSTQFSPPQWIKLGQCVWSGPACLHTRTKLSSCYPDLGVFFKKHLGVQDVTAETLLYELQSEVAEFERTQSSPSVPAELARRIKDLIMAIKPGRLAPFVLQALRSEKLWPCQYWEGNLGTVALARLTDAIFIPDHEYWLELFYKKFPTLDLSPSEAVALKPLFVKLGVKNKLLSNCVTETASAKDESLPSEELSHRLRERAQALSCCAERLSKRIKTNSKENLHEILNNIQVFQASDISSTYIVGTQGIKEEVTTPGQMLFEPEFFDPKGAQLKLFVPRDQYEQKHALDTCLARGMMRFLGLSRPDSWQIVTTVLTIEPARLNSFLQRQGILNPYDTNSPHPTPKTVDTVVPNTTQIKTDTLFVEDETFALEKTFSALALVSKQHASEKYKGTTSSQSPSALAFPSDKKLSHPRSTAAGTAPQKYSSNLFASISHQLTTNAPSNSKPVHLVDGIDVARPVVEMSPEQKFLGPNNGGRVNDPFLQKQEIILRKGKASDLTSMSLFVTPPQAGRRSSPQSSSASTIASSYSSDTSTPSSNSPGFEDTKLFNTPTKKTSKAKTQLPSKKGPSRSHTPVKSPPPGQAFHCRPPSRGGQRGGPDVELGYLGEKFVVEILKKNILDFDEEKHWTSKLRKYENSPDLSDFHGSETADITYPDSYGYLSILLKSITQGQVPSWLEDACTPECTARPTYYLEVKTTAGSCKTNFFVSEHQYDLMKTKTITGSAVPKDVYIVLRVFDINKDVPRVQAYLDPWSEGKNGGLKFSVGYKVTAH